MDNLIRYIPLDKSWIIRMGILDLINNHSDTINFLKNQDKLSDDLQALLQALIDWNSKQKIYVGESGTLYRFLQFASWKLNLGKKFILKGTLQKRKIFNNPEIVNWKLKDLLNLDNKTSQWASAAVLLRNKEKIINPPFKLKLTYEAVRHWKEKRAKKECWILRYDKTILAQAEAYLNLLKTGKINFIPKQAEDYCFARAFNLITKEEGERKWLSLRSHESDRIEEMEKSLDNYKNNKEIESKDHRVIQAIVMSSKAENKEVKIKFCQAVNKSWPQFWDFLKYI
jgi:hypothetical protein